MPGVLIVSGLSHQKGLRSVCILTQVYTHIYHCFHNYPSVAILGKIWVHTDFSNSNPISSGSFYPHCIISNLPLWVRNPAPAICHPLPVPFNSSIGRSGSRVVSPAPERSSFMDWSPAPVWSYLGQCCDFPPALSEVHSHICEADSFVTVCLLSWGPLASFKAVYVWWTFLKLLRLLCRNLWEWHHHIPAMISHA